MWYNVWEYVSYLFFQKRHQTEALCSGVSREGSIEYAECTQAEDAKKIRQEISGESHEVDYAIHVLLTAGMSTPSLRDIARAGVDIERTAYSGIASSVVILFPVDLMTFIFAAVEAVYLRSEWWRLFLSSLSVSARLILAWMLCRSSIDERCFMLKVMDKIVAALLGIVCGDVYHDKASHEQHLHNMDYLLQRRICCNDCFCPAWHTRNILSTLRTRFAAILFCSRDHIFHCLQVLCLFCLFARGGLWKLISDAIKSHSDSLHDELETC